MSFRTVNGSTHTEDGWQCCNRDECDVVRLPNLTLVDTAPLRKGAPLTILGAWLFWYDRNVEEINSPVWGWSETNDVLGQPGQNDGSNHLSATAVDVNAPKYPFGLHRMTADKIAKVEEGLRLFPAVFWGRVWSKPDEMHYQMRWREGDPQNEAFAQKLLGGYLGIYGAAPVGYGLPRGSNSGGYGGNGVRFPDWVYQLGNAFGVKPSTYPGHQETNRNEAGYAPNPQLLNRGIDWAAPGTPDEIDRLTRFADYLASIPKYLEQVIWQNPKTMRSIEVAGGRHQPGYFQANLKDHRNHVHTRQSQPIPMPGGAPPPPPGIGAADVLARATGITLEKAIDVLPRVSFALTKGNCTNPRRIAAALAQWVIESGHFVYTEEIANGPETQERWKYKGRTWIQLTWLENYLGFSRWCHSLGLVPSPTYFGDRPRELAEQKWAALGPAYWWAIKYPQINEYADRGDIDNVSKWVNAPAWVDNPNKHANHEKERRDAYNRALALGDQLLALISNTQPPAEEEDDMIPIDQWNNFYHAYMDDVPSLSPLRHLDEKNAGPVHRLLRNIDGSEHIEIVKTLAMLRHPPSIALLQEVAGADPIQYPDRQGDAKIAEAILADIFNTPEAEPEPQPRHAYLPEVIPRDAPASPVPVTPVEPETTGDIIGRVYEDLKALRLADALPIEDRAPLAALIAVLSTKNGSQI